MQSSTVKYNMLNKWCRPITFALVAAFIVVCAFMPLGRLLQWYSFVRAFECLGRNEQGYLEYRHRMTGIVMVRVPGGVFTMGSSCEEVQEVIEEWLPLEVMFSRLTEPNTKLGSRSPEEWIAGFKEMVAHLEAPHLVTLDEYLIAKYEVSQTIWEKVMESNPSEEKAGGKAVYGVSWEQCRSFCDKSGLRIPTEAQWEYAARAGSKEAFWCGRTLPGFSKDMGLDEFRSRWNSLTGKGLPVTEDPLGPNTFGLYNVYGSFSEFCQDFYDPGFYVRDEAKGRNPICESDTGERCYRGACSWASPLRWRAAARGGTAPMGGALNYTLRPAFYPMFVW